MLDSWRQGDCNAAQCVSRIAFALHACIFAVCAAKKCNAGQEARIMQNFTFRLTDEQKKQLAIEAKLHGMTITEWTRTRLFRPTTIDDFAAYKAEQQAAFQRVCDLLLELIAYQKFAVNVAAKCLLQLDPHGAAAKLQALQQKMEQEKREAKQHD